MAKILLGVCGGISVYKSCELLRELQRRGDEVRVIMTGAAQKFVTPLTFEALSGSTVYTDMFGDGAFGTAHIETARWADLLVVAPATANTIGRFSGGQADDFLSTAYLATRAPVLIAPAMNSAMWEHRAVQKNMSRLKKRGVHVIEPPSGDLACGETGAGRMAEPDAIADEAHRILGDTSTMIGKKVVVTAGPTREYLDPVRYLSSPSTGKMGLAVAREASRRGATVTVVHGPVTESLDFKAKFVSVTTAEEMAEAVSCYMPTDIFVGAAAVADYQPADPSPTKRKKEGRPLEIPMKPTTDILHAVARNRRPNDLVIGFAAETTDVVPNAKMKLEVKHLDLVVANEVDREKKGFAQNETTVTFVDRKGPSRPLENVTKDAVARALWDRIETLVPSK